MKHLAVTATMSRPMGRNNGIRLSITDERARVQFVRVDFTLEEFANLLTNRTANGTADFGALDRIGTIGQNKTERVPFDYFAHSGKDKLAAAVEAALAPFEVDGWRGQRDDMTNSHKRAGKDAQLVTFFRNVKPEEVESSAPSGDAERER